MTRKTQPVKNRKTVNHNLYSRKAHQLRANYLARLVASLRRSIGKTVPALIDRIMVRA